MDRAASEEIIKLMGEINGQLNDSIFLVMPSASDTELKRYKAAIGVCMGEILCEIVWPIIQQYPELTPDHLKEV